MSCRHCIRSVAGGVNAFPFAVNLREFSFRCLALDVVEECREVAVDVLAPALAVQKDFRRLVAHLQRRILCAGLAEGVLAEVPVEGIECADEDDVGLPQFRVELALVEHVHVHHGLIVARTLGELRGIGVVGCLHLDIVGVPLSFST